MIFNFVSQIILLILLMFVVHGCWVYIQDNVLKKKTEIVTPNQIQKYEKMIEDLQSQISSLRANKLQEKQDITNEVLKNLEESQKRFKQ